MFNMGGMNLNFGGPKKQVMNFGNSEEFKMVEDEDDCVDLLKEKKKAKNLDEFYAAEELDDLKNQLRMNMPPGMQGMMKMGLPSMSQPQTNNNTEASEVESSEH